MSNGTVHWFNQWKHVRDNLEQYHPTWRAFPLSTRDTRTWKDALILWAALTEDLSFSDFSSAHLRRWLVTIVQMDTVEVFECVKEVDEMLISRLESEVPPSPADFKHRLTRTWKRVLTPVFSRVVKFLDNGSIKDFRGLHQWCVFITHISFVDIPEGEEVYNFLKVDMNLHICDWDLVDDMNKVMRSWLDGFTITSLPRHSNGATYEAKRGVQSVKWDSMGQDDLIRHAFRQEGMDITDYYLVERDQPRTSRMILVPKTVAKRRTICAEPSGLQYLQQMVFHSLDDWFRSTPLRRRIDLHSAERNRKLAQEASRTGLLATIDLSAASDSVSWDLVKHVFRGTSLLKWLYATRSRTVELPSGVTYKMKKFTSMGSALCFPVECLIFACVCEVVKRRSSCRRSRYSVYGDDIIIETELVQDVITALQDLGFTVNTDKSFFNADGRFRESCGMEAANGVNVTPWRLSRWFCGLCVETHHPDTYPRMIQAVNTAFMYGYGGTRRILLNPLLTSKLPLPFGYPNGKSDCVYTWTPNTTETRYQKCEAPLPTLRLTDKNWNRSRLSSYSSYQRVEKKGCVCVARNTRIDNEEARLLSWFLRRGDAANAPEPQEFVDKQSMRLATAWTAVVD